MRFVLPLIFLLLSNGAVANNTTIFIGNGGEGIETPHGLVLRDLYEAQDDVHPYIGPLKTSDIQSFLRRSPLAELPVSQDLLVRKLTDLEGMSRGLGFVVLTASQSYQWLMVQEALTPVPDDGSTIDIPASKRMTIANRNLSTIRISTAAWKRLPPEHQVALLLHEALYSVLRPDCEGATCVQTSSKVRDVVGLLFSPSPNIKVLNDSMLPLFDIPDLDQRNACESARENAVQISGPGVTITSLPFADSPWFREEVFFKFCAGSSSATAGASVFKVTMSRIPYIALDKQYVVSNGALKSVQRSIQIAPLAGFTSFDLPSNLSLLNCMSWMRQQADVWFDPKVTAPFDPHPACAN